MTRILGVDPGSLITGYGLIESSHNHNAFVDCGAIRTPADRPLAARLSTIFQELGHIIARWQPAEVAVEQVFMARNPDSALKLGQARGVAILAAAEAGLPVHQYAPRAVKQAVVGAGGAEKSQVQHMVAILLNLQGQLQADAADALAIALCHGHSRGVASQLRQPSTAVRRSRRWTRKP